MDRQQQSATELRDLRALCCEATPRDQREQLLNSLSAHSLLEPEHQVVFESIRALFSRGPVSAERLRVHLNNRGFPDTDVDQYFQSSLADQSECPPSGDGTR
jgi:hypothetical protein